MMGNETFSILGVFVEPFYSFGRKHGVLSFLRSQWMDIEDGEILRFENRILLADKSDVAAITNRLYDGVWVSGELDVADAAITVSNKEGPQLSYLRSSDGHFRFRLPQGSNNFSLTVLSDGSQRQYHFTVVDESMEQQLGKLDSGGVARLLLPRGEAMSIIFHGIDGTADPLLMSELTGLTVGGKPLLSAAENNRVSLAGFDGDISELSLAPGKYRVIASRGIEYDAKEVVLELSVGEVRPLNMPALQRVVNTEGLMNVDFHVHSGISMDSSLLPRQRIIDFVAQGGELLVASEHNITVNLEPLIHSMGLANKLRSFAGVELTGMARSEEAPMTIGHSNVFPVQANSQRFMGGTLPFEGRRLGQIIGDYKEQFPSSIFQLNHPRAAIYDDDLAFFDHLSIGKSYQPALPINAESNRSLVESLPGSEYQDIDFDAIEILNGEAMDTYELNKRDWFSLLRQGYRKVATANSDSHSSHQLVAMPRNYLTLEADSPAAVDEAALVAAIKSGKVMGSNGPIIRLRLAGAGPGDTAVAEKAELVVSVDAAPWVVVDRLRVYINGELYRLLPIAAGESQRLALDFQEDSFVTVEVSGDISGEAGELYRIVAPGMRPLAFTNPVFVDPQGDGLNF